jgi:hypothetical protein
MNHSKDTTIPGLSDSTIHTLSFPRSWAIFSDFCVEEFSPANLPGYGFNEVG